MAMSLLENIADAKRSLAETAISSPYIYHEYGEWEDAKRALVKAQQRLSVAEKRWHALLAPALTDKLLYSLAKRKKLIPTNTNKESK